MSSCLLPSSTFLFLPLSLSLPPLPHPYHYSTIHFCTLLHPSSASLYLPPSPFIPFIPYLTSSSSNALLQAHAPSLSLSLSSFAMPPLSFIPSYMKYAPLLFLSHSVYRSSHNPSHNPSLKQLLPILFYP